MGAALPDHSLDFDDLSLDRERASAVDLTATGRFRLLLKDAIRRTYAKQEAAAFDMGVDPSYLTKQLKGEKPMPTAQLARLSREFWSVFGALLVEANGQQDAQTEAALRLIEGAVALLRIAQLPTRPRMAKAGL